METFVFCFGETNGKFPTNQSLDFVLLFFFLNSLFTT